MTRARELLAVTLFVAACPTCGGVVERDRSTEPVECPATAPSGPCAGLGECRYPALCRAATESVPTYACVGSSWNLVGGSSCASESRADGCPLVRPIIDASCPTHAQGCKYRVCDPGDAEDDAVWMFQCLYESTGARLRWTYLRVGCSEPGT